MKNLNRRPIHELLIIVRDNAKVELGLIEAGLCCEIHNLCARNKISHYEKDMLYAYIEKHMPKYVIPSRLRKYEDYNQWGFGWLPRKWKPRLKWLNIHIERTTNRHIKRTKPKQ